MDDIERKQIDEIVDTFIEDLKKVLLSIEKLTKFLQDKKQVVSVSLESKLESLLAEYKTGEYRFCLNLVKLYEKRSKPHPLRLQEEIKTKEKELTKFLKKIRDKGLVLYEELLQYRQSIDPLLLMDFTTLLNTTFEDLQKTYEDMVSDKHRSESVLRQRVLKALAKVVENLRDENTDKD